MAGTVWLNSQTRFFISLLLPKSGIIPICKQTFSRRSHIVNSRGQFRQENIARHIMRCALEIVPPLRQVVRIHIIGCILVGVQNWSQAGERWRLATCAYTETLPWLRCRVLWVWSQNQLRNFPSLTWGLLWVFKGWLWLLSHERYIRGFELIFFLPFKEIKVTIYLLV